MRWCTATGRTGRKMMRWMRMGMALQRPAERKAFRQQALDNIYAHPNLAPFVAKQLIQKLVASNPSPAYVQRVAWAFESLAGPHALSTSFGVQSAVSLHLLTQAKPDIPVLLVDTGYLFPETYRYADTLTQHLGLNLQAIDTADPQRPEVQSPLGTVYLGDVPWAVLLACHLVAHCASSRDVIGV